MAGPRQQLFEANDHWATNLFENGAYAMRSEAKIDQYIKDSPFVNKFMRPDGAGTGFRTRGTRLPYVKTFFFS